MSIDYKQTVLIVHNHYQVHGGEDTVVNNEKRLLEEHGHRVILYTRHNNELKKLGVFGKIVLLFSSIYNLRTVRDIKRIINDQKIDIVHIHNTLPLISPSVYYAARKCNIPVVQTIHNFRFLCPGATFYRDGHICEDCLNKGIRCSLLHKCYRNSYLQTFVCVLNTWIHRQTGILKKINYICLTDFNKEKLLHLECIDPKKVFIKPNFSFGLDCKNEENSLDLDDDYFLFIGRIEEIKGVKLLIEAFNKLPNEKLKLAGKGPLLNKLEHSNNIEFLGFVPHEELVNIIKKSKAVILPSQWYEGFPMIISEVFSLHKSIIAGDVGNNGILIINGENGLKFLYNDVDSLVKTILLFNKNKQLDLEKKAYIDYLYKFSPDSNYMCLKHIYDILTDI